MRTPEPPASTGKTRLNRRGLLKTVAWTSPIAVVAVSAPAVAASTTPLLGGILTLTSRTAAIGTVNRTQTITVDGSAAYPTSGIWMENVPSTPNPTSARYTLYLPSSYTGLTWSRLGTETSWSVPVLDSGAPAISGYTAYTTTYANPTVAASWTRDNALRRIYATGRPYFRAVRAVGSTTNVPSPTIYSLRRVSYGGQNYTLQRGPSTLA